MSKKPHNAEYVKQYNRKKILNLLSREPLSRAELARRTGLTRSAISVIVDELLSSSILIEHPTISQKRGRSPSPLTLNTECFYAAGIYLNRQSCHIGLLDISGKCHALSSIPLTKEKQTKEVMDAISDAMKLMLQEHPKIKASLLGIGISAPGPLDISNGRILNPPEFDLWHQMPICEELKKSLHYPVYLSDNADSLAIYNMRYNSTIQTSDFMLLLVDSGIGSGIISNGILHRGVNRMSPEIGHISINYNGKKCGCGNRGCLEAYASIPHLFADTGSTYLSWEAVMRDVQKKAPAALKLLETEAEYLASGIMSAINLFSLDTIILAGDILCGFDDMQRLLLKKLRSQALLKTASDITITASDTREHYHIISAANIVFTAHLNV